jgi:hypothetical protein
MLYNLKNSIEEKAARVKLDFLISKGETVEITRKSPKRTLQMNKYLYVLLGIVALDYCDTVEYVKLELYKKRYNKDIFETVKENKDGKRVAYRSSADLTTAEMALSIERLRDGYAKDAGVYLPDANEDLTAYENEIEKHKRWL